MNATSRPGPHRHGDRPIMKQVADRAGVAVSSVSRVLSGHPDVSEVMRHRVLDAVSALGYRPDFLAQSLRTGATMTVGFVMGDISNPLMSEIALGAETQLRQAGYAMLLTNSLHEPALDVQRLELLQQRRVDGILLSLNDDTDPDVAAALTRVDVPAVLVDREVKGASFGSVLSDHRVGVEAAVRHLLDLGHQRIALVNGAPNVRPSRERAAALRRACRGSEGATCVVRAGAFTPQHGYQATISLLGADPPPTALIAGGNQVLVGVLGALSTLGLTVPEDLSLVTCDDVPLAEFLSPPISTIARDVSAMGSHAARLLLEQLHGGPQRSELLPTAFRPTHSCSTPAPPTRRS
jgi:LacI family transcriptional regulator